MDLGEGSLTGLGEYKTYDGPWQEGENLQHYAIWGKYLKPTDFGSYSVTLSGYSGDWRPTEQSPERVIGSAVCADAFCTLDPTATGHTSRWIAGAQLDGDRWNASAYLQYYDWYMQSNPTYDYQINQFDRRATTGGRFERSLVEEMKIEVNVGAELRYDDIGPVGVDHFDRGQFIENIARNDITESSLGAYTEVTWLPTARFRLLGGLRADYYDFDVAALSPGSFAGQKTDSLVSPKLGIAFTVNDRIELYGNWGKGFHSNDARGVVNSANPLPGLSPGTGYEGGARFEIGDFKITSAYWWLDLDSELIFVGDSNSVEPRGASKRDGYEITAFWRPKDWLGIDLVYTGSNARYLDNPEGTHIEGSVEEAGEFGVSATKNNWEASLRVRYLGPYPLTPDDMYRAGAETTISLRGAYTWNKLTFYADLLNVPDSGGKDIVYWYPAYVAGFDPPGLTADDIDCGVVNCRMSRAQEPRTLRVGIKYEF